MGGRGSLGAFPWLVPLALWWVHCNTHSFICQPSYTFIYDSMSALECAWSATSGLSMYNNAAAGFVIRTRYSHERWCVYRPGGILFLKSEQSNDAVRCVSCLIPVANGGQLLLSLLSPFTSVSAVEAAF